VNRRLEIAMLMSTAVLVAFGTAFVNLARGGPPDAEVGLTSLVFALSWGGIYWGVRTFAPQARTYPLLIAAALSALGLIEVYRLDMRLASRQRWWFIIGAALTVAVLAVLHRTGLRVLRRYRYLLLIVALGLLLMPLLPESGFPISGRTVNGSRLWVAFGTNQFRVQFQPGEFAKLVLIIVLASLLGDRPQSVGIAPRKLGRFSVPEPRQLVPVLIAWTVSFVVLVSQRDLGASLLLFSIFILMLYAATGQGVFVWAGGALFVIGGVAAARLFSHVQSRVDAWIRPFDDPLGSGYQIVQGLFAMGSGSLTGSGFGLGRPDIIPFAATDFIYAALAEELGLAGSVAILSLFALLVAAGAGIALSARDQFRKLLAAGIAFGFGIQAFLIIAGVVRVLPLTGITLPFMSYGGSSLLVNLLALALLTRVSHEERS
jgi:cell division protein FtsW (lipid II flippase)